MHLTGIPTSIFVLVLLSSFVQGASFDFEVPPNLVVGENATLVLRTSLSDSTDVKIFITENASILSRTYANGWKSSSYYILAAIPEQKIFTVQPTAVTSHALLCVRLRPSGSQKYKEQCHSASVSNRTLSALVTPLETNESSFSQEVLVLAPVQKSMTLQTRASHEEKILVFVTLATILVVLLTLLPKRERMF